MLPDFWGSDYDYDEAHGRSEEPLCAECEDARPERHVVIVDPHGDVTRRNVCRACADQFYPEEAR